MSARELLFRVMLRLDPLRRAANKMIVPLVRRREWRQRLNAFYEKFDADEKALFQSLFAKAFTHGDQNVDAGQWNIRFESARLRLPLRTGKIWLDWDNAVSIVGHDLEVKSTYGNLLRSTHRPQVFFDIGANYGTHSLLFLANGVRTVSFEPNPFCQEEFVELCKLNDVEPELVAQAVGDRFGEIEYWFPERDTWLGSTVESTQKALITEHEVQRMPVKIGTIDEFVSTSGVNPDLIKIDTEGNELGVLKGARKTIRAERPLIIFEANKLVERESLWDEIVECGNVICSLPFSFESKTSPLLRAAFLSSSDVNFIALPSEHECVDRRSSS